MSRLGLALTLLLAACTDRQLDGAGVDTTLVTPDLAGRDLRGVDFAGVDFSSSMTGGIDMSVAGVIGVPCGSAICTTDEACCVSQMGTSCAQAGMGGGGGFGACGGMSASFRCDGPEDCDNDQHCVGTGGQGFIVTTRCRNAMGGGGGGGGGMNGPVICHTSNDCSMGQTCTPTMSIVGAPPLSDCE